MKRSNSIQDQALAELHRARQDLLDVLEGLEPNDWDKATLCEGWRVRDVVSHVASSFDKKSRKVKGSVLNRRDRTKKVDTAARELGNRPVEEILAHYRGNVESTSLPSKTAADQALTDVVIHSLDICHPNGWELSLPADRIRMALSTLVTLGDPYKGKERAEGLHCDTTDIDWRCGCGAHVRGPSRSMVLALAGRSVCDQLNGDGVAELASRH